MAMIMNRFPSDNNLKLLIDEKHFSCFNPSNLILLNVLSGGEL